MAVMPKYKAKQIQDMQRINQLGKAIAPARGQKMCLDKKQFKTRNEARDFALRSEKRHQSGEMGSYKCQLCGLFHLTTITAAIWKNYSKNA